VGRDKRGPREPAAAPYRAIRPSSRFFRVTKSNQTSARAKSRPLRALEVASGGRRLMGQLESWFLGCIRAAPRREMLLLQILSLGMSLFSVTLAWKPRFPRDFPPFLEEHLLVRDGPFCAFVGLPFLRESFLTMTAPGPDQLRQQVTCLSLSFSFSSVEMDSAEAVP